jgi:hypothetical protein
MACADFSMRKVTLTTVSREITAVREDEKSFNTLSELELILKTFDSTCVCPGIVKKSYQSIASVEGASFIEGVWRSSE